MILYSQSHNILNNCGFISDFLRSPIKVVNLFAEVIVYNNNDIVQFGFLLVFKEIFDYFIDRIDKIRSSSGSNSSCAIHLVLYLRPSNRSDSCDIP